MLNVVLFLLFILILFMLVRAVRKQRNAVESKLSVLEHPSTYTKPEIEMVSEQKMVEDSEEKSNF